MNFTSMDYFIAVAEEQSFTRAAERMSVTQQTLSAHIAGVEKELGVRLLNRSVPLSLTYAGEVFLDYARSFQASRRAMQQQFKDIAGNRLGRLAIGVASTRGRMIMPHAIALFQRSNPGIDVRLHEGENAELVSQLKEGRFDMALATVAPGESGLVSHELYKTQIVLVVSNDLLESLYGDRAETVADEVSRSGSLAPLEKCPFMLLGRGDEPGDLSRRLLREAGFVPWVRVYSKNSETLMDLAIEGVGACFVPLELAEIAASASHGREKLRIINLGKSATVPVCVAWRDSSHVWSIITEFGDFLEEQLSDDVHRLAFATGTEL